MIEGYVVYLYRSNLISEMANIPIEDIDCNMFECRMHKVADLVIFIDENRKSKIIKSRHFDTRKLLIEEEKINELE